MCVIIMRYVVDFIGDIVLFSLIDFEVGGFIVCVMIGYVIVFCYIVCCVIWFIVMCIVLYVIF